VSDDHRRGIELTDSSNEYPGIDDGTVDYAPEERLKGYQAVLALHEHTTEIFFFSWAI